MKLLGPIFSSYSKIVQDTKSIAKKILKDFGNVDYQICLLKGGFVFSSLLAKYLKPSNHVLCDVSFYKEDKIIFSSDFSLERLEGLSGKNVLIVDDLVASGRTADYSYKMLTTKMPAKIGMCALIDKVYLRETTYQNVSDFLKYKVYTLESEKFVVGFGMCWPSLPKHFRFFRDTYELREKPESYLKLRSHA